MSVQLSIPYAPASVRPLTAPLTVLRDVSRSSLVLALLRLQGTVDAALPEEFTSADVAAALSLDPSDGGVSGFLSRACRSGMIRVVRRQPGVEGRYVFTLLNRAKAPGVRRAPGRGSAAGKHHRGVARLPVVDPGAGAVDAVGKASSPHPLDLTDVFESWQDRLRGSSAGAPANDRETAPAARDRDRLLELTTELTDVALRVSVQVALTEATPEQLLAELGKRLGCETRAVPT